LSGCCRFAAALKNFAPSAAIGAAASIRKRIGLLARNAQNWQRETRAVKDRTKDHHRLLAAPPAASYGIQSAIEHVLFPKTASRH
jgi:hypothetical protein